MNNEPYEPYEAEKGGGGAFQKNMRYFFENGVFDPVFRFIKVHLVHKYCFGAFFWTFYLYFMNLMNVCVVRVLKGFLEKLA